MKKTFVRALFVVATIFSLPAWAFPSSSFIVAAGSASYSLDGNIFNITTTPNTILDWADFSIGAGETINFMQASSSSAVQNRILGGDASLISGSLLSNGSLSLHNPTGFVFTDFSLVKVGGDLTLSSDRNIQIAGLISWGSGANNPPVTYPNSYGATISVGGYIDLRPPISYPLTVSCPACIVVIDPVVSIMISDLVFTIDQPDFIFTDNPAALPVPEPHSLLMLLAGLGLFGMVTRHRS
ncbi:MAG: filamentous hemagglutinin N-terminal domain-containing protein [Methylophilaceae bacterium]